MAVPILDKYEIEYVTNKGKAEGIDLKARVQREGSKFKFYISGDIHSKKIDVNMAETYGSPGLHAEYIALELNRSVLEASGYVLDGSELRENVQVLLNNVFKNMHS